MPTRNVRFWVLISFFSGGFLAPAASAYVAGASSVPTGSFELGLKTELMRGLAGPENLPESQQKQTPNVNIYEVAAGYNVGTHSVFQDVKFRLLGSHYTSEAELLNGSQIHPRDDGWILGAEISSNFVHEPDRVFGVFLRAQHPISMNIEKFINPKIDTFGVGFQTGYKFSDSFGQETVLFLGSGVSGDGFRQNASLSASLLAVWILSEGIFKDGAAIRLGPFYDGDLAERGDLKYGTQGFRAFRLGLVASASYSFNRNLSMDFSYIQKFTGAYFRATKDFIFALRIVL